MAGAREWLARVARQVMGAGVLEILTGGWNLAKMGFSALGAFLKSLNAQGVVGLLVSIALAVLAFHEWSDARHWSKQDAQDMKALHMVQASDAKLASRAQALKTKTDAQSSTIAEKNKELNDAQNARIDADAAAARVRGPGKATCHSIPAAPAGEHEQAAAPPQDAGPQMPTGDIAAVPWPWLVQVIQEHDELLNEVQTWRRNDKQQREAWPKGDGAIQAK